MITKPTETNTKSNIWRSQAFIGNTVNKKVYD